MGPFAFIVLMITALGGTLVLVEWYDGERHGAPDGTTAVVFSHVGLALVSLVLLAVFLAIRGATLASAAVVAILLTAAVGVTAADGVSQRARPDKAGRRPSLPRLGVAARRTCENARAIVGGRTQFSLAPRRGA